MGFFNRLLGNTNTPADISKKGVTNTIENKSDVNMLMWTHPLEDFNTNTTLVVNENETALFIKGGSIVGVYAEPTPERGIRLSTSNYAGIRAMAEVINGGASQYKCKIIYVRHNISQPLIWGTPIGLGEIESSINGIIQNYIGNVEYSFKVTDAKAFYRQFSTQAVTTEHVETLVKSKISTVFQSVLKLALSCPGRTPSEWIEILKDDETSDFQNLFIEKINKNKVLKELGIQIFSISPNLLMTDDNLLSYSRERNTTILEMERRILLGDKFAESEYFKIQNKLAENSQAAATAMGMIQGINIGSTLNPSGLSDNNRWDDPWEQSTASSTPEESPKSFRDLKKMEQSNLLTEIKEKITKLEQAYGEGFVDKDVYEEKLYTYRKQIEDLL